MKCVMRRRDWLVPACAILLLMMAAGCGPSSEASNAESTPPALLTKESLYRAGHRLYLQQQLDSAKTLLRQALALDSTYTDALTDLASLHVDLAARPNAGNKKGELLRQARSYYMTLESLGVRESDVYERICELSTMLHDDKTFLKYAKKNVELYPFDRQYYNLSHAYFNAEEYNNVIDLCKFAIEKFKLSPFIGTFYRQLGRAYMKVDRDQTAEKTFYAGLGAIEQKMAELRKSIADGAEDSDYARLKDDTRGILISLKYLHTTYKAAGKLAEVEKRLKELGK
jgi:tetratricopeptide (TPR) repeat protein